ncbi:MAG: hypothetical protein ABIG28_00415 [archaeon]
MRSKLAPWSWILPLIGLALSFIVLLMAGEGIIVGIIFVSLFVLGASITGLIFGITALRRISKNSKLTGKGHAIVGIILNGILLLIFLYRVVSILTF